MLTSRCLVGSSRRLLLQNTTTNEIKSSGMVKMMGQQRRQALHLRLSHLHQQQRHLYNHHCQSSPFLSSSRNSMSFVQLGRLQVHKQNAPYKCNFQTINLRYYFNTRRVIPREGSESITAKTVPLVSNSQSNWTRFAWYVKIARLPFLISAIYALGYQQGVMQTASNPLKLQQGFFETICIDLGVTSGDDIDIISERRPASVKKGWMNYTSGFMIRETAQEAMQHKHDPRTEKVATIGRNIIRASRFYVREELNKAVQEATEKLDKEINEGSNEKNQLTPIERQQRIHGDENVSKWLAAQLRVEGETLDGIENWQYILVGTALPNAFVSQLLPQRFFVTTGLFEHFVANDDELAMILGHEISHLILGHLSQSNNVEFFFRGAELFILAIDPTEGLMSLGVASFLSSTRDWLLAAFSRENETEADELGCKLAAMACYDTIKGSKVFLRMHEFDEKVGSDKKDVLSTHPPSKERYDKLVKLSQDENLSKYSQCQNLRTRLNRALSVAQQKPGTI